MSAPHSPAPDRGDDSGRWDGFWALLPLAIIVGTVVLLATVGAWT